MTVSHADPFVFSNTCHRCVGNIIRDSIPHGRVGLYLILNEFLQTTIFAYMQYAQHMHSLKNIYGTFNAGKDFFEGTKITDFWNGYIVAI